MHHRIGGRKLKRKTDHREAMLRNLVTSLIVHERIVTTEAKAKELRKLADRMVSLSKKGGLAAIRKADSIVRSKEALGKLFTDLGPRFKERNGGYTRSIKYKTRKGDSAPMVVMEWVEAKIGSSAGVQQKSS